MVPGYRNGASTPCGCGAPRRPRRSTCRSSTPATTPGRPGADLRREHLQGALPGGLHPAGPELRLQQQYFFVACSLRDYIEREPRPDFDLHNLPERIIFQLNDTHPVIAVPELMRLLVDERRMDWDEAWAITQKCFAYTCHTLLPEALEVWPTDLLGRLLPRHLEIIYRINEEFLERSARPSRATRCGPADVDHRRTTRSARCGWPTWPRWRRTKVNGVAELHSQLLRDKVLPDFSEIWPDKFTNVTNGVTPRRFIRWPTRRCRS
jgi:starch phosphorylase